MMNRLPLLNLSEPWMFSAAFVAAALVTVVAGWLMLPLLHRLRFGQRIRTDGPRRHLRKQGTPTMGGASFILALLVVLPFFAPMTPGVSILLGVTLGGAVLGFSDDFLKVVLRRPLGLRGRSKLVVQLLLGALLGWGAMALTGRGTFIVVPWWGEHIDLGIFYPAFTALLLTASSNAVNITDGLDGLAAGGTAMASVVFVAAALARNQLAVALFGSALLGVCIGFLWHNFHPARVFMGDTGSLALGSALAGLAVLTETDLLLVVAGGLFVVETLSVMIQVTYFRLTGGRRLLRMSPLHHHFELLGWNEVRVVLSMWAFQLLCVVLAFLGLRGMGA